MDHTDSDVCCNTNFRITSEDMMEAHQLMQILKDTEGYLEDNEGVWLFANSANTTEGSVIEIGSWKGKSTVMLGLGIKAGAEVRKSEKLTTMYAIDPHKDTHAHRKKNQGDTYLECIMNLQKNGLRRVVTVLRMTSKKALKHIKAKPGFIFIDGDHSYEGVKLDYELYYPLLLKGGIMAFHDTHNKMIPGPHKLMSEIYKSKKLVDMKCIGSITCGVKP